MPAAHVRTIVAVNITRLKCKFRVSSRLIYSGKSSLYVTADGRVHLPVNYPMTGNTVE